MRISGVYKIENRVNGKFYIGSSKDIEHRWLKHKYTLNHQKHHNLHLQLAWNKYGENNFDFSIIETTDKPVIREQIYLDTLKPAYNINPIAGGCDTWKNHPRKEERKKQLSKSMSGKRNHRYGIHPSEKTIQLIRDNSPRFNGNKNGQWKEIPEDTKQKIRTIFRTTSYRNTVRWAKSYSIGWRVVKRVLNNAQH